MGKTQCFPVENILQFRRSEEMKKFLSVAVALGMVAGAAATASALELSVKGKYQVDGYWIGSGSDTGRRV